MKRLEGVTVIAIWHWINALFLLLGACVVLALPIFAIAGSRGAEGGRIVAILFIGLGVLSLLAFSALGIAAGWGLWRMKEWARWLSIVLAVLSLFNFPVGTITGALIIWYLLRAEVVQAFGAGLPVVPPEPGGPVSSAVPLVPPAPPSL